MKLKEKTIEEINNLNPNEISLVYDFISTIKKNEVFNKKTRNKEAILRIRNALSSIKGSLSEEIIQMREDRI